MALLISLQKRREAPKQISHGLDDAAKELLATNLKDRERMDDEITELRKRNVSTRFLTYFTSEHIQLICDPCRVFLLILNPKKGIFCWIWSVVVKQFGIYVNLLSLWDLILLLSLPSLNLPPLSLPSLNSFPLNSPPLSPPPVSHPPLSHLPQILLLYINRLQISRVC